MLVMQTDVICQNIQGTIIGVSFRRWDGRINGLGTRGLLFLLLSEGEKGFSAPSLDAREEIVFRNEVSGTWVQ